MLNILNPKYRCRSAYKIRQVTKGNKTGDSFAITIPKRIAEEMKETFFSVEVKDDNILLQSGTYPKID